MRQMVTPSDGRDTDGWSAQRDLIEAFGMVGRLVVAPAGDRGSAGPAARGKGTVPAGAGCAGGNFAR